MVLLINKTTVSSLLQVAIGVEETQFENFIREAQEFDFKPLMEEVFYFEILQKRTQPAFQKLLQGVTYTYNGVEIQFRGLNDVLAYFTYARFFLSSPAVSTSHGIVTKTTPHSEPVSLEERRNVYYKKREEANALMKDVINYIERNIADYPKWKSNNCQIKNKNYSTRVLQ